MEINRGLVYILPRIKYIFNVIQDLIDVNLSVDEDCLHLAVSTPNIEPAEPLPVMVFIYGGGFKVIFKGQLNSE